MRAQDGCVVHLAGVTDDEALGTLCRTTQVIAALGIHQILLVLDDGQGADVIWSAALPVEVRSLRAAGSFPLAKVRTLQSEFSALARERMLYAVHLHGAVPCLVGSRALKGTPVHGRVLYSPHIGNSASPWTVGLVSRLLQSHLEQHDSAAVTASLAEAQTLSRLLNRSAEVLPHPVSATFFEAARREATQPGVLVDGVGAKEVDAVTHLSVLLNGRAPRVRIAWLGGAGPKSSAQLAAGGVDVLDVADEMERARLLSRAWAYLHLAEDKRLPYGVAQAMAAGVPCLVSDTLAHRALVRHGETGFVCTSDRDVREKLIVLLRDAREREQIGQAARAEAKRRFTSAHFERAILRAYGFSRIPSTPALEKANDEINP